MRTERHRLTIFILLFAAFFSALVLFFAPLQPAAAATDPDETLGSGGETGGSSGETGGEEPAPAQNVATVTSGGSTTGYADFSSALAAWTEGATLTLLKDVTASTVTVSVSFTLDPEPVIFYQLQDRQKRGHPLRTIVFSSKQLTVGDGFSFPQLSQNGNRLGRHRDNLARNQSGKALWLGRQQTFSLSPSGSQCLGNFPGIVNPLVGIVHGQRLGRPYQAVKGTLLSQTGGSALALFVFQQLAS